MNWSTKFSHFNWQIADFVCLPPNSAELGIQHPVHSKIHIAHIIMHPQWRTVQPKVMVSTVRLLAATVVYVVPTADLAIRIFFNEWDFYPCKSILKDRVITHHEARNSIGVDNIDRGYKSIFYIPRPRCNCDTKETFRVVMRSNETVHDLLQK